MVRHKFVFALCTSVAIMVAWATSSSTNAQTSQFLPNDCVKTGLQGGTLYWEDRPGEWDYESFDAGHVFRVEKVDEDDAAWLAVHDRNYRGKIEAANVYRVEAYHCARQGI
jgi:hypothetical protein